MHIFVQITLWISAGVVYSHPTMYNFLFTAAICTTWAFSTSLEWLPLHFHREFMSVPNLHTVLANLPVCCWQWETLPALGTAPVSLGEIKLSLQRTFGRLGHVWCLLQMCSSSKVNVDFVQREQLCGRSDQCFCLSSALQTKPVLSGVADLSKFLLLCNAWSSISNSQSGQCENESALLPVSYHCVNLFHR